MKEQVRERRKRVSEGRVRSILRDVVGESLER
jgi:hypothetical protein